VIWRTLCSNASVKSKLSQYCGPKALSEIGEHFMLKVEDVAIVILKTKMWKVHFVAYG
jgi:hypothetical protein